MKFSVVVTTYNRAAQVAQCLEALARLDYDRSEFEVIVVDDGGSQPLEEIVNAVSHLMTVRLLKKENGGAASGRNHGAREARGEYLAFTDDDCAVDPGWLAAFARRFELRPDSMLGGKTLNGLPENPYASASQLINDVVYEWYNRDAERSTFFATNNLALSRRLYWERGGLDERMWMASEDREFCRRWRQRGGNMVFVPEAIIVHRHPLRLRSYLRQHFAYGRGAARFYRYGEAYAAGGLWPQLAFYPGLLPRYIRAARRAKVHLASALPLMALWQAANTAGYLREWLAPGD